MELGLDQLVVFVEHLQSETDMDNFDLWPFVSL